MRLIDADVLIPNDEECNQKRCIDCEWNYIVGCEDVEKLIKLAPTIELYRIPCKDEYEYQGKLEKAYDDGYDTGYAQAKFDYEPRWIPVDERLPEDGSVCLISLKSPFAEWVYHAVFLANGDPEYSEGKTGESGFYNYDSTYGYYKREGVIAWMPVPEPYREKE